MIVLQPGQIVVKTLSAKKKQGYDEVEEDIRGWVNKPRETLLSLIDDALGRRDADFAASYSQLSGGAESALSRCLAQRRTEGWVRE